MGGERRNHKRTRVVLPLRMWLSAKGGTPAMVQFAHTIDVTENGARLGGIHARLDPGDTVTLRRGQQKLQFRVKWTEQMGPNELHAGIESVAGETGFWGVNLTDEGSFGDSQELLLRVLKVSRK